MGSLKRRITALVFTVFHAILHRFLWPGNVFPEMSDNTLIFSCHIMQSNLCLFSFNVERLFVKVFYIVHGQVFLILILFGKDLYIKIVCLFE